MTVSLVGWASPMPRPDTCLLSHDRVVFCQLCGDLHFDGASVAIHGANGMPLTGYRMDRKLSFTGKLDIWMPPSRSFFEPQVRLVDARPIPQDPS